MRQVCNRMSSLTWRPYTPEEDQFIMANYGVLERREIAAKLGRTMGSIDQRYNRIIKGMVRRGREEPKIHNQTLCWTCKNATANTRDISDIGKPGVKGCPWSIAFRPVPGWEAKPTIKYCSHTPYASYDIQKCPMWERG